MLTLTLVIISLVAALSFFIYKTNKLNKQVLSLYGMINGLKVENNILENRLELLEELPNV